MVTIADKFKRLRTTKKNYNQQGQIYFTCINYVRQPEAVREKIDRLCESVGGEFAPALKEFLTTSRSYLSVCDKHYISTARLDRLRTRFYDEW